MVEVDREGLTASARLLGLERAVQEIWEGTDYRVGLKQVRDSVALLEERSRRLGRVEVEGVRERSLRLAIEYADGHGTSTPGDLISAAREFEGYLGGGIQVGEPVTVGLEVKEYAEAEAELKSLAERLAPESWQDVANRLDAWFCAHYRLVRLQDRAAS